MVTQAYNPGIQEAEVKGSLLVGQPRLQSETRDPASKKKQIHFPTKIKIKQNTQKEKNTKTKEFKESRTTPSFIF